MPFDDTYVHFKFCLKVYFKLCEGAQELVNLLFLPVTLAQLLPSVCASDIASTLQVISRVGLSMEAPLWLILCNFGIGTEKPRLRLCAPFPRTDHSCK